MREIFPDEGHPGKIGVEQTPSNEALRYTKPHSAQHKI